MPSYILKIIEIGGQQRFQLLKEITFATSPFHEWFSLPFFVGLSPQINQLT